MNETQMDMVSSSSLPAWSYHPTDEVEYGQACRHIIRRMLIPDPAGKLPVDELMTAFGLSYQPMIDCCFDAGFCDVEDAGQFIAARWRFECQS